MKKLVGAKVNLQQFYIENIKETDYYYNFFDSISNIEEADFEIYDDREAIEKLKSIIMPDNEKHYDELDSLFICYCYYLDKKGYQIEQFPDMLSRPSSLQNFAYKGIRLKWLKENGPADIVPWMERSKIISDLKFSKVKVMYPDSFEQIMAEICNQQFRDYGVDDQLVQIANAFEFLLKQPNGKFRTIDYEQLSSGVFVENDIKGFRRKLHAFRHSSKETLIERNQYSEIQKHFFIQYGIAILCLINDYLNGGLTS